VRLHVLDADRCRVAQGSPKVANVIMIGFAAGCGALPLSTASLRATLKVISPERVRALNLEAFQRGMEAQVLTPLVA